MDTAEGAYHEPLPAFAADQIDDAVKGAAAASSQLLGAGMGDRLKGAAATTGGGSGDFRCAFADGPEECDVDKLSARGLQWRATVGGGSDGDGGDRQAIWSVEQWVASLGVSEVVSTSLLRHLRASTSLLSAELAFISRLGQIGSRAQPRHSDAAVAACMRDPIAATCLR